MTSASPVASEAPRAVFLFGGTRVEVDGQPCRLSPNELALVAVVFAAGSISRPEVVRLLWNDPESSRTRHRVRQLLHRLASKVGPALIEARGDQLIRGPGVWSDTGEMETAIAEGRYWDAGRHLEKGPIQLAYARLPDAAEDWFESYVERSRRDLKHAAQGVWAERSRSEDWSTARDAAEALYCLDPEARESVMRVIEARARVGKVAASEAAFARYCESDPAEDDPVFELIDRVRKLDEGSGSPSANPSPVFVGRKEELAEGRAALERVAAGGFEFVLVTGEAGIGKTRLLEELRKDALLKDFRCLSAKSSELERIIPLNPLLDALGDVDVAAHLQRLGPPWDAVVSTALPRFAPDDVGELPPIQESSLTRRLLDAMSMLLESIAVERPTVLFLDDLHWADATTVTALQFFQRRWADGQFGVIATARPTEARRNEATSTYLGGAEDLPVTRIHLNELSDEEAVELVQGILGSPDDDRIVPVCQLGGPHPLFLVELARDALRGGLALPDASYTHVPIPVSLKQMLEAKTSDLPESAQRVARVLAVMGRPVAVADIVPLTGLDLDACVEAADFLEARGLARAEKGRLVIAHDLFRSSIYSAIGSARRLSIHQIVATHLESVADGVPDHELATHFLLGGDTARGAEIALHCAQSAWESGAMVEAASYYELAAENDADETRAANATARWARALQLYGDQERVPTALEMAASRLRATGDQNHARRMELYLAQAVGDIGVASFEQIAGRLAIIRQEAETAHDWEAVALAYDLELRVRRMVQNEIPDSDLIDGLRHIIVVGSSEAQATAHEALAVALSPIDPSRALHHATRAIELSPAVAGGKRLSALNRGIMVLYHQGRLALEESRTWIDEAREIAERSGNGQVQFSIENNLGAGALDAADFDRAEVLLGRAAGLVWRSNSDAHRSLLSCNLGELALMRGEFERAREIFNEIVTSTDEATPRALLDLAKAGLGICALELGRLPEARRLGDELSDESVWPTDPTMVLVFRARLLDRQGHWDRAAALLSEGAEQVKDRMVLTWLRLVQHHAYLLVRRTNQEVQGLLAPAISTATELSLLHRERELRTVLELGRAR